MPDRTATTRPPVEFASDNLLLRGWLVAPYQPTVLTDMTVLMKLIAPTPLRVLIADNDVLPGQREAFEAAAEPKSLVELPGHHYSLYTTAKDAAIASAREWFVKYLTPDAAQTCHLPV